MGSSFNTPATPTFQPSRYAAVLFDLDGVLTSTAKLHAACWKQTFDAFLRHRARRPGAELFRPFDDADYHRFVDGKPRYDGVRSFLASRGVTLPEGTPASPPDEVSVCGLGNQKEELVERAIDRGAARAFPDSVAFLLWVRGLGLKTAVVSSSHSCRRVLQTTGLEGQFDAEVDGQVMDRLALPGKPAPDVYLHAARLLAVPPPQAVVVEDAIAGVAAGRAGAFGLVIGIDRGGQAQALRQNGADLVVAGLGALLVAGRGAPMKEAPQ